MAHVVSVGYARTQTKKKIQLFKEDEEKLKEKVKKIDPKKKKAELDFLQEKFKK